MYIILYIVFLSHVIVHPKIDLPFEKDNFGFKLSKIIESISHIISQINSLVSLPSKIDIILYGKNINSYFAKCN